ncbi:hypothetical protein EVAR_25789_1 [Eumeta japonica]|uniref:Ecdysteroid UDP-glucosyltransferase n=1 Tax=Eumeta variegata TaxID=151549 RepID=A0A4C1VW87_EUMVA|nr:hypothetical protein EVAR_25789_1 [Eumeta japonica]
MLKECAVLCIISSMIWTIEAFKVLLMFPLPAPSHGILGNGYVEHLLNAGHEVVLFRRNFGASDQKTTTCNLDSPLLMFT